FCAHLAPSPKPKKTTPASRERQRPELPAPLRSLTLPARLRSLTLLAPLRSLTLLARRGKSTTSGLLAVEGLAGLALAEVVARQLAHGRAGVLVSHLLDAAAQIGQGIFTSCANCGDPDSGRRIVAEPAKP